MALPAAYNTAVCYLAGERPSTQIRDLYSKAQVTGLQCRTFGTWTLITAVTRLQAAYQLQNEAVYKLATFTFITAAVNFTLEWCVFGTMTMGDWLKIGGVVDTASALWMLYGWRQHWYF